VPTRKTKELVKTLGRQLRDRAPVAGMKLPEVIEVCIAQLKRIERERAHSQAARENDTDGADAHLASTDTSIRE
jgi:hypothetical protein